MDNQNLIAGLKSLCRSPEPVRRAEFLRSVEEQGLADRRPVLLNHGEFLLRQFFFIQRWVWVASAGVLLFIAWMCRHNPGNYPFALTPLLAAGILWESRRSFRWKMAELEHASRFSLRSVALARLFLVGAVDTVGLMAVAWIVRPALPYSLIRVLLYMTVPYLTASLSGSVYERKRRPDGGWGSVAICALSSVLFAAATACCDRLYDEGLALLWVAALLLLACCLTVNTLKWMREMEEPIWNL